MANRSSMSSLFRRFQRTASDAEESISPVPVGTPIPYPNTAGDTEDQARLSSDPSAVTDGSSNQLVVDEPAAGAGPATVAFDEADAIFGGRTDVLPAKEVSAPEPDATANTDAGEGLRHGAIEMNEIVAPNNVVDDFDDDFDDDFELVDLTGGAVSEQLTASSQFSLSSADLDLDDLDDLDDPDDPDDLDDLD